VRCPTPVDGGDHRRADHLVADGDLAAACKQLIAVECGWRDMKGALRLRPVYHYRETASASNCAGWPCCLSGAKTATGGTWRTIRHELDRLHLVALATARRQAAQRSATTPGQQAILHALDLPEPPKLLDVTAAQTAPADDCPARRPRSNTRRSGHSDVRPGQTSLSWIA
jgi:hypothetical protein